VIAKPIGSARRVRVFLWSNQFVGKFLFIYLVRIDAPFILFLYIYPFRDIYIKIKSTTRVNNF